MRFAFGIILLMGFTAEARLCTELHAFAKPPVNVLAPKTLFTVGISATIDINPSLMKWQSQQGHLSKAKGILRLEGQTQALAAWRGSAEKNWGVHDEFVGVQAPRVYTHAEGLGPDLSTFRRLTTGVRLRVRTNSSAARLHLQFNEGISTAILTEVRSQGGFEQEILIPISAVKTARSQRSQSVDATLRVDFSEKGRDNFFEIIGPIVFERDIRDRDLLRSIKQNGVIKNMAKGIGGVSAIDKIVQRMFDPKAQQYALALLKNKKATLDRMHDLQIRPVLMKDKLKRISDFFISPNLRDSGVPIEADPFAQEHGAASHLAQIFAVTHSLPLGEAREVSKFILQLITTAEHSAWATWEVMFDGAGNSLPSEPRFWRDRIEYRPWHSITD